MEKHQAKRILWESGNLRFLLNDAQKKVYDAFRGDPKRHMGRIWYLNISRQFGKSYTMCVLAIEECLRRPKTQVKYCAQDQKNARSIVFPQMDKILASCPEDLIPKFKGIDGVYHFANGSRITIAGADKDNIRKLRGQSAHLCIIDEGGFMPNLKNVVMNVMLPQTTTTKGRLIVATTPPDSAGHYAQELAMLCKSRGAYAKFDIWENNLLSEVEKGEIIREFGGVDTTGFRREYLCEFVTDTNSAVVPEFTEEAEKETVHVFQVPEYYDQYTSLDGGYTDAAAILFGFVDFKTAKLHIQREWVKRGALGSDIAEAVSIIENDLWKDYQDKFHELLPEKRPQVPFKRVMDVDPELSAQFLKNHGQYWSAIEKQPGYKQAAVNQLNDFIRQRRLVIHPDCKILIRQLHNATWDSKRKSYKRDDIDAHYDLVDALVYMLRVADFTHNMWPNSKKDLQSNWLTPEDILPDLDDTELALKRAFSPPLPE